MHGPEVVLSIPLLSARTYSFTAHGAKRPHATKRTLGVSLLGLTLVSALWFPWSVSLSKPLISFSLLICKLGAMMIIGLKA